LAQKTLKRGGVQKLAKELCVQVLIHTVRIFLEQLKVIRHFTVSAIFITAITKIHHLEPLMGDCDSS
jgi:hypothetical protein